MADTTADINLQKAKDMIFDVFAKNVKNYLGGTSAVKVDRMTSVQDLINWVTTDMKSNTPYRSGKTYGQHDANSDWEKSLIKDLGTYAGGVGDAVYGPPAPVPYTVHPRQPYLQRTSLPMQPKQVQPISPNNNMRMRKDLLQPIKLNKM